MENVIKSVEWRSGRDSNPRYGFSTAQRFSKPQSGAFRKAQNLRNSAVIKAFRAAQDAQRALVGTVSAGTKAGTVIALLFLAACTTAPRDPVLDAFYAERPATWRAESPERVKLWVADRTDCVGYVLRGRQRLLASGVPADHLRIAVFYTPQGWHAALLVDDGGTVWQLDNREARPVPWNPPPSWHERDHNGRVTALWSGQKRIWGAP